MRPSGETYRTLFLSTFQLSACTFGGGFVIIPLMRRKFVEDLGWIGEQEMLDLTAIAQSSPGAIAVNASILVGYRVAGLAGALLTVLGLESQPDLGHGGSGLRWPDPIFRFLTAKMAARGRPFFTAICFHTLFQGGRMAQVLPLTAWNTATDRGPISRLFPRNNSPAAKGSGQAVWSTRLHRIPAGSSGRT